MSDTKNLSWNIVAKASDDEVKHDLELTCTDCNAVLCDVEDGDVLAVLVNVAQEHNCQGLTLEDIPTPPLPEPGTRHLLQREIVELLNRLADGREEYAASGGPYEDALRAEAQTLRNAAKAANGDLDTVRGLLPSWRWNDAENNI